MSEFIARSFVALPHRCLADKRFRLRHFKVLGAICRAVDPQTGEAKISQERVARLSGTDRRDVRKVIPELEAMGYLTARSRGKNAAGRAICSVYEIRYEAESKAEQDESKAENHGGEVPPRSMAARDRHGLGGEVPPVSKQIFKTSSLNSNTDGADAPPPSCATKAQRSAASTKTRDTEHGTEARIAQQDESASGRQRELPVHGVVGGKDHKRRATQQVGLSNHEAKRKAEAENRWTTDLCAHEGGATIWGRMTPAEQREATTAELARRGDGAKWALQWAAREVAA